MEEQQHIRFSSREEADQFVDALSAAMGYPKTGKPIGGGIHVPAELAVTRRYTDPQKHPERDEWAVRYDEEIAKIAVADPRFASALARLEERPPDWDAPPPAAVTP